MELDVVFSKVKLQKTREYSIYYSYVLKKWVVMEYDPIMEEKKVIARCEILELVVE